MVKGKKIFRGEDMKSKVLVAAVMLFLLSSSIANAKTLSNWGPTGISEIPTADVIDLGVALAPSIGFYDSNSSISLLRIPVTVGVGFGIELGVTQIRELNGNLVGLSGSVIHTKINLIAERPVLPGVSIGGIFDPNNILGTNSLYLVATKGIGNLKGHIGIGDGIYGVGSQFSLFGGLEFRLTDNMTFIGFYKSESVGLALSIDILPMLNATITYHNGTVIQLGASVGL